MENKTIKPICFSPFFVFAMGNFNKLCHIFDNESLVLLTLSNSQKPNWVTAQDIERGTK